jgi:hypothetical protein
VAIAAASHVLLIDLDEVLVHEPRPGTTERRQIISLHGSDVRLLSTVGMGIGIVTHRSRSEASSILRFVKFERGTVTAIFAAEDIFWGGMKTGRVLTMARRGLLKSLALPRITRHFGVPLANMAMIDDRAANLQDMKDRGIGLAIHAPFRFSGPTTIESFDMRELVRVVTQWTSKGTGPTTDIFALAHHFKAANDLSVFEFIHSQSRIPPSFNAMRRLAAKLRRTIR